MAKGFKITGMNNVSANLNKALKGTIQKGHQGLIQAAILVRRDMNNGSPKIPLMDGNLQASWFVSTFYTSMGGGSFTGKDSGKLSSEHSALIGASKSMTSDVMVPRMVMGFSAYYATFVHEMPGTNNFSRPGSGPKFFESALNRTRKEILLLLGKEMQL